MGGWLGTSEPLWMKRFGQSCIEGPSSRSAEFGLTGFQRATPGQAQGLEGVTAVGQRAVGVGQGPASPLRPA